MFKPTRRTVAVAAGAAALVLGGAVAAVGAEVLHPSAVDPAQSGATITDESFTSDGVPVSTTVTEVDAQGHVLETSTTTP